MKKKTTASLSLRSAVHGPLVGSRDRAAIRPPPPVLLTEEGQKLCRELRRETWFVLMTSSPDPTMRRLGAGIFVAAAMNELVPSRASWDPKPVCTHCGRSRGNGHQCTRKQVRDYFQNAEASA